MNSVLLIAHDAGLRSKVNLMIRESGLNVSTAQTGTEGLHRMQQELPGVVVAQDSPVGQTSIDLIREVKRLSPETVVLMLLNAPLMQRAMELMKAGAYDCMEPAVGHAELLGAVRRGLGRADSNIALPPLPDYPFWKKRRSQVIAGAIAVFMILLIAGGIRMKNQRLMKAEQARNASALEVQLPYTHPSGIVFDGAHFWVSDWFSQSIYEHARDEKFTLLSVHHFADSNPVAVCWSGSILWTISSNGVIQKSSMGEKLSVIQSARAPGSQPSGIAHDGNYLWTCDMRSRLVYKHLPDSQLSVAQEFNFPGETPIGLFYDGSFLWAVDGTQNSLIRLRQDGNRLLADQVRSFAAYRKPGFKLVGATFDGERFWSLADGPARVLRHELIVEQKAPPPTSNQRRTWKNNG